MPTQQSSSINKSKPDLCLTEAVWKRKTEFANKLFDRKRFTASIKTYQEAHLNAEILNDNMAAAKDLGIPVLQIFTISCNNLAFNHEELESIGRAEKMLKRAIYFLLLQSNNKLLDPSEIHQELRRAMFSYTEFAKRNDIDIRTTEEVFTDIREHIS